MILLNAMAALAATGFAYNGIYAQKNIPQYRNILNAYLEKVPRLVKNDVEKVTS